MDPYDYSSMSVTELHQLKGMTQQSLDYYIKLLGDTDMNESEKHALQMCYDITNGDMDDINAELERREAK
jgi:predicted transcriptional regulator